MISSKYVTKNIFRFIPVKHFEHKLFPYSQKLQKKFEINYSDCYKKYLDELDFDLSQYLFKPERKYEKYILRREYDNFISKNRLNKKKFEKIICRVIKILSHSLKERYINIDSPFTEILSKISTYYYQNYTIYRSQKNIDEYNLKDDYIEILNKLNNPKINYSSIYYIMNEAKADFLKELSIRLSKFIRKIRTLKIHYNGYEIVNDESSINIRNILNLFKNLVVLTISGNGNITKILDNVNLERLLHLSLRETSNINILEKVKFHKLKTLYLIHNHISDISVLEKGNFKELRNLNLYENEISDIKVFEKVGFDKLESLDLRNNKIIDISTLGKVNFKELKELNLSHNKISDITVLKKVQFYKLKKLYLDKNEISDIDILENADFKELKQLSLYSNKISDIKVLEKVNFLKIETLYLNRNQISDIKVIEKAGFYNLKSLWIGFNQISDINILKNDYFINLKELDLSIIKYQIFQY